MRIKIGTRNSPLALWQAQEVAQKLHNLGYETTLVPIIASGDKNLTQPLYSMGITGVFTKDLDIALLNKEVDIAVHSLKDVPTQMPKGLSLVAYLERDFPQDVLVRSNSAKGKPLSELVIATSSLRRRAFWKKEFPKTVFVDIRGNVQTRLEKLNGGLADATLFSLAGLKRLDLEIEYEELPFMLCAPSQGVVAVASREEDTDLNEILSGINHQHTQQCVEMEREFLQTMEGGCTAPVGAFARINQGHIHFHARLCSLDGNDCLEVKEILSAENLQGIGAKLALQMLQAGGDAIMQSIRNETIHENE